MDNNIKKGAIFYVVEDPDDPSIGNEIWPNRPAVIVSNDALNRNSGVVGIVYLSTSPRKYPAPTHVTVTSGTKTATALCEQIHTVSTERLKDYIGCITESEIRSVEQAIMFTLGINTGTNPQGIFKKFERHLAENSELKKIYAPV